MSPDPLLAGGGWARDYAVADPSDLNALDLASNRSAFSGKKLVHLSFTLQGTQHA